MLTANVILLSKYFSKANENKKSENTEIRREGISVNNAKKIIYFLLAIDPLTLILFLIELKISQISIAFNNMQVVDFLFGSGYIKGGDFVWLHFFRAHGLFGAFVMALLILTNINKKNAFGVLIIVLMTGHYFVLFSLPGQLITGYLLATNEINKN